MHTNNPNSPEARDKRARRAFLRDIALAISHKQIVGGDEFTRPSNNAPSKRSAKHGRIQARFVREHPKVKSLMPPESAYRAAGLR
jgi:hypothetical protein